MKPLVIGDLVAKIPIIQGGMGVGISLSTLAGAVAKEGGIGIISTAQIGFKEPDFDQNPLEANMRALEKHIKKAREIAPLGVIGVNIMVATKNYAAYVKKAVECGIDLIISGAGLPMELPELVRGSKTKIIPIVSPLKAASVILKTWDRKSHTAPDAVVIEGPKAGGHLGFKPEQLMDIDALNYDEEIVKIIDLVKQYEDKYQKPIPVIVAGGISNKETMEHYMELGASGVQIATPFVTTEECDADIKYKEAYINCKKEDIIIVKSPVGLPARAIRNAFQIRLQKEGKIPVSSCHSCIATCKPKEIPYCITEGLVNAATGNVDHALLFCGADAYLADKITTVKEVISRYIS